MGKLKKGAAVIGGTVVGIVTLRALRNRRSKNKESDVEEKLEAAEEEVEEAEAGLETAAEHATAAVEHAGAAAKKALEARAEKAE
jgi:uncharacterized membrane-anchored protein YhcB (DUF1043 family)